MPGDSAATADSALFQLFFAGELVSITAFLLVAMALYRLLAALVATAVAIHTSD